MIESFSFTVPIPPSLNQAYPTNKRTGRRHCSKMCIEYQKILRRFFFTQRYKTFRKDIELWLYFAFPDNRWRDLSNYIKVLEDCLVKNAVIEDDHLIDWGVQGRLKPDKENPHVKVIIYGEV